MPKAANSSCPRAHARSHASASRLYRGRAIKTWCTSYAPAHQPRVVAYVRHAHTHAPRAPLLVRAAPGRYREQPPSGGRPLCARTKAQQRTWLNSCFDVNAVASLRHISALPWAGRAAPSFRHFRPDGRTLSSSVPYGARARCWWGDGTAGEVGRLDSEVRWPGVFAPKKPMSRKLLPGGRTRPCCTRIRPGVADMPLRGRLGSGDGAPP